MKKKGFTLIELLAVIVILAIIALIAVPIILHIVEKSKKSSAVISAESYIDAMEKQMAIDKIIKEAKIEAPGKYALIKNSEYESDYDKYLNDIVKLKGKYPSDGYVIFNEKKNIETAFFEIDGYFIECSKNKCQILLDPELKKWEPILKVANIKYNESDKVKDILNKDNSLKITGNEEAFKLLIGNKGLFKSFIESEYGDTALYVNGAITESLINTDEQVIEILKQSSKYEVVSYYKKYSTNNKSYVILYDSPAFVFGISQDYVSRTDRYTHHGKYQNGSQYITNLQMKYTLNKDKNLHGLIYPVNKFADKVEQIPNYPNTATYSATSYAAIYKLDIKE